MIMKMNDNENEEGGEKEDGNDFGIERGGGTEYDLAARGMVSLSPKAPPPPPPEEIDKEELSRLGIPLFYAEERKL